MNSLKDSKVSKKNIFFTELTRLQQKGSVDKFTREWVVLASRVPGLSTGCLVESYIIKLKLHINNELKLHAITTMEDATRKEKSVEKKKFDKTYSR